MGAEASCGLRENGVRHTGRALLETDDLIFRGTDGFRLKLPLKSLRNARASDGDLLFDSPAGPVAVELGSKAERWARGIRSPKGVLDKLDLKASHIVATVGAFDPEFIAPLAKRVACIAIGEVPPSANVVFVLTDTPATLRKLTSVSRKIARNGAIWVVHPKGPGSRVKDSDVFSAAKKAGLIATKVARFSETHTAEKLVIPVAKR